MASGRQWLGTGWAPLMGGGGGGLPPFQCIPVHHLHRKAIQKKIFSKKIPHDTNLEMTSASWGIVLSHICWGASGPPPQPPPSARRGVPVTGALKGRGGGFCKRGSNDPPPPRPPAQANPPRRAPPCPERAPCARGIARHALLPPPPLPSGVLKGRDFFLFFFAKDSP